MHGKFIINSDISKTYCNNYLLVIIALGFGFCSKAQKCIILKCNPLLIMKSKTLAQKIILIARPYGNFVRKIK